MIIKSILSVFSQKNKNLTNAIRSFNNARVLVVGDIILDKYVIGSASRLSPEAPIPVLRPDSKKSVLGGAGNVAMNISSLGGTAYLVGVVGADDSGNEISNLCFDTNITPLLKTSATGRPTTTKTRYMAGSHQLLRVDDEVSDPINDKDASFIVDTVLKHWNDVDVIVLSDYAKGVLCDDVLDGILDDPYHEKIIIVDPKRNDFSAYRGATILTPNEAEIKAATGVSVRSDADAEVAGSAALRDFGGDTVIVTRSAKGLSIIDKEEPTKHLPTVAREVWDVSGAGDTLVATLATALASGASVVDSANLANIGAGISVSKQGTATVSQDEILSVLTTILSSKN